jgi:DNA-directed RNA polymerase specialized sigma24 family protein
MRNDANQDEFAALYARAHVDLLRYVLTLLPDRHQAEDVVQDTARLLWRKFDEYDPAQPFLPWARKFAYFEVLKFRRSRALREKYFSDELLERLASWSGVARRWKAACKSSTKFPASFSRTVTGMKSRWRNSRGGRANRSTRFTW